MGATDKTTLQIEVQSGGVVKGAAALTGLSAASKAAKISTTGLGTATGKTSGILGKFLGQNSKISAFLGGGGGGGGAITKFTSGLTKMGGAAGAATIAIAAMIALKVTKWALSAAKATAEFTDQLANIATLIPDQVEKVQGYGEAIVSMSQDSGKSLNDLAGGVYQVISAFGDQANSLQVLEIASNAAKAGMSTTTEAINLLSAVSKGYNDTSTETIQKIADLSFETVRLGQTNFPQLAAAIGRVVPLAASLGISMEELFTAEATLTGVTGSAAEVSTQLRGSMAALMKPTEALKKLYHEMGVGSGKEFIAANGGLNESLLKISATAELNGQELTKYIGRVEAVTAAMALTEGQQDTFNMKFAEMQDASGAASTALRQITDGVGANSDALKQGKAAWDSIIVAIGDIFLPIIALLARSVQPILVIIRNAFQAVAEAVKLVIAILTPLIKLSQGISKIFLGLVNGSLKFVISAFRFLTNVLAAVYKIIADKVKPIIDRIKDAFDKLIKPVKDLFGKVKELTGAWNAQRVAMVTIQAIVWTVVTVFDTLYTIVLTLIDVFKLWIGTLLDVGKLLISIFDVKNWGTDRVEQAFREVSEGVKSGIDDMADHWGEFRERQVKRDEEFREAVTEPIEVPIIIEKPEIEGESFDGDAVKDVVSVLDQQIIKMQESELLIQKNASAMNILGKEYDEAGAKQAAFDSGLKVLLDSAETTAGEIVEFADLFSEWSENAGIPTKGLNSVEELAVKYSTLNDELEHIDSSMALVGKDYDLLTAQQKLYTDALAEFSKFADVTGLFPGELKEFQFFFERWDHGVVSKVAQDMEKAEELLLRNADALAVLNEEFDIGVEKQKIYDDALAKLLKSTDVTAAEIEEFIALFSDWDTADAVLKVDAVTEAFEALGDQLLKLSLNAGLGALEQLGATLAGSTEGAQTFEQAMAAIGNTILQGLPTMLMQAGLQLIASGNWVIGLSLLASSGILAIGAGAAGFASENAKGNVFNNGAVQAFGKGGAFSNSVVSTPTVFPMANGGIGLMGEAGDEAIIPLKRTSSGALGVNAEGLGGGGSVEINVINNSNEPTETSERTDNGKKIVDVVIGTVKRSLANGTLDPDLKRNYGINRRGVTG